MNVPPIIYLKMTESALISYACFFHVHGFVFLHDHIKFSVQMSNTPNNHVLCMRIRLRCWFAQQLGGISPGLYRLGSESMIFPAYKDGIKNNTDLVDSLKRLTKPSLA